MTSTTEAHITIIIRAECPSCGKTVNVANHIDKDEILQLLKPRNKLHPIIPCDHCEIPFSITKLNW